MSASIEESGDGHLRLRGSLDFYTVPALELAITPLLQRHTDLHVDLGDVRYADSSGVALLVRWLGLARERNQQLCFSHVPAQMQCIIQVCALEGLLPMDESAE